MEHATGNDSAWARMSLLKERLLGEGATTAGKLAWAAESDRAEIV